MADPQADQLENESEPKPKKGGLLGAFLLLTVAGIVGAVIPFLRPDLFASVLDQSDTQTEQSANAQGDSMTFVAFGEVTVNLDEGRMNRYLRLKISLQVRGTDQEMIDQRLADKQLVLRNWLLSHLSDKTLDEIRGKAGQNMLRREIRDYFNTAMFTDGRDRIYDVLFEEFNVQ